VEPVPIADLTVPRPHWTSKRIRGLSWDEVSLDTALAYLRTVTGKNFFVSPKAREEKFDEIVLSLQLDDVTVKDVLGLVTEPYGLRWEVRWERGADLVAILTAEEFDGLVRLRYYDIKDLVTTPPSADDTQLVAQLKKELESLVPPEDWGRDDLGLEARNGVLVARARPAVHAAIDAFLRARRAEMTKR
jgi:hypothetical protein